MRYRPEIDGLRAISVVAVVIFHAEFFWRGKQILPGGYLGVDVFFVISGYLITSILLDELAGGRVDFWRFYMRRIRRILPALYVVIGISTLGAIWLLPPDSLKEFSRNGLAALSFVANIYLWLTQDYFSEAAGLSSLLHLWSLSVEEQFYVAYPLLLGLIYGFSLGKPAKFLIGLSTFSLFLALGFQHSHPAEVFYLVQFRAWELLAGSIVAAVLRHRSSLVLAELSGSQLFPLFGGMAVLAAFVFGQPLGLTGYAFTVLSIFGACSIIAFAGNGDLMTCLLSSRPFVGVGLVSYSLYLWHQPIFAFARHYAIGEISHLQRVLLVATAVIMAVFTWLLVERPFRKPGSFSNMTVLVTCAATTVVLAIVLSVNLITEGLPQRYTPDQQAMMSVSAERGTLSLTGQDCKSETIEKACMIGSRSVPPTWAVLGDSHAETLSDALSRLFEKLGVSAEILTYPGCPYVLGVDPVYTTEHCADFANAVLDKLRHDRITTVVINDRINAYMEGTRFDNHEGGVEPGHPIPVEVKGATPANELDRILGVQGALLKTIQTLLDSGLTVIYIAPVPEVGWNVPHTVLKLAATGALPLTTARQAYLDRNLRVYEVLQRFDGQSGFLAVYPEDVFCNKESGRCITHTANRLLYTDTDHLSREGATMLVEYMTEQLRKSHMIPAER
ncbi:acyltransferase family protein [Rhizobium laguerreae]|uniref:acyltransferase family protein n=1 Tax=Rhizobium laguerreae TaxID=1076926 RepID=UPI001C9158A6|nr:acyltransferase family protein [Rhizobium laguerreae]MBY3202285.1 acyltransferase [Rhizobium laguerreae]MBY3485557.1 acyltransferase [Rhizobium laguerreae]